MTPSESQHVATEIAELRRSVDVGFARVDGSLALLVQRSDQTDKAIADHETRLDGLERNRWPLPTIAALAGLGSLLYTLLGR
ncbi:hypothetical protein ACFCYM_09670 [Streptomyces sp. NPDC056254]|uniref:hypothetical protein n=1 Tax=Streptomyces sp. NPDC056254 TaxID=3345763 RepID=UPI0035D7B568